MLFPSRCESRYRYEDNGKRIKSSEPFDRGITVNPGNNMAAPVKSPTPCWIVFATASRCKIECKIWKDKGWCDEEMGKNLHRGECAAFL